MTGYENSPDYGGRDPRPWFWPAVVVAYLLALAGIALWGFTHP